MWSPQAGAYLDYDDTVLLERILARGDKSTMEIARKGQVVVVNDRANDNVHISIQRLKNYHKHHHQP